MTTISTTYAARHWRLPRIAFPAAPARILARVFGALATERRNRSDVRELLTFNDHMLKDIGLSRDRIAHVVRYGRFE